MKTLRDIRVPNTGSEPLICLVVEGSLRIAVDEVEVGELLGLSARGVDMEATKKRSPAVKRRSESELGSDPGLLKGNELVELPFGRLVNELLVAERHNPSLGDVERELTPLPGVEEV